MNDTFRHTPVGKYSNQLLAPNCIPTADLWKQRYSDTGNSCIEENGEISGRELGSDRYGSQSLPRTNEVPA